MKKRKPKSKKDINLIDKLYFAVADYVKSRGGSAIVANGVQIQQWPNAPEFEYIVGVKIIGRAPKL